MDTHQILLSGITVFPIIGVIILLIWRNAAKKQAALIGIVSESIALVFTLMLLKPLNTGQAIQFSLPWIAEINISFSLELNWLAFVFLLTEILVTLAAMIYSLGEKTGEKSSNFYYALLLLFSLGMSGTTLSNDVFLFYVFWELMLLASVLLILIWGHGEERSQVSLKYFIITHIGSLIVLICLITLYVNLGTANISELILGASTLPPKTQSLLTIFFIIGFCVKMAIFPLHIWLPDAHTVAPMPVTIILAAAMLSMGTYGILRFPIALFSLEILEHFSIWMMIAGLVSEIYGALMSLAEKDIKRIIAYSSVSQMGYILFGLGSLTQQGMVGSIMHVVYHAIVKALLFMVVGIIIAATNERDIERLGGLGRKLPVTTVCVAIGVLGISGMPPLGIFNSEWMIFSGGFETSQPIILTILTLLGSIFTVIYALRFFGKIFLGKFTLHDGEVHQPKLLVYTTAAVTALLVIEGLLPSSLISWATEGLSAILVGGPL